MNYSKIYNALIEFRKINIIVDGYSERHHIKPKSLGGTNESSNIIRLRAREHFIAHLLLAKIHGGKMWAAVALMMNIRAKNNGIKNTSRLYETARIEYSKRISIFMLSDKSPRRGYKYTDEEKMALSEKSSGMNAYWYGRVFTDNHKANISKSRIGIMPSAETIQKRREARTGYVMSDESRLKLSASLKGHAVSDATREKLRNALTGRKVPEEQRLKNVGRFVGELSPLYGIPLTKEVREKISKSKTGKKLNLTQEQRDSISIRHAGNKYYLERQETESSRESKSASAKKRWQDDGYKEKVSIAQKASWTQERRDAASKRMTARNLSKVTKAGL